MSKTLTLRLDDNVYRRFRSLAQRDNRPISNFIETAALRFVNEHELVDEFEMEEIENNGELNRSIKAGQKDAEAMRGSFV